MSASYSNEESQDKQGLSKKENSDSLIEKISIANEALTYSLLSSKSSVEDVVCYGISVSSKTSQGIEEDKIVDITTDYKLARKLYNDIIDGFVTPVSLRDVVEDYIASIYSYN